MVNSSKVATDIDVLTSSFPIPGFGLVPIDAFVIKRLANRSWSTQVRPYQSEEFMSALQSAINPADLKWLWLTHTDFDHIGCLPRLLAENPRLRVIATFLGVGIMGLASPPCRWIGSTSSTRVRRSPWAIARSTAFKPPVFDNPCTTGFTTKKSGVFFSSDCFGALLSVGSRERGRSLGHGPPGRPGDLGDDGFAVAAQSGQGHLAQKLDEVRRMAPTMVLSSHLPPAPGHMIDRLLESLAAAPGAQPFVGPNQAALEQMLKAMTAVPQ